MSEGRLEISQRSRQFVSAVVTSVAAALGVIVFIYVVGLDRVVQSDLTTFGNAYQQGEIDAITKKVAEIAVEQENIRNALKKPADDLRLKIIAQRIENIERRQAGIERAIVGDPEKVLAVPILRNDLQNVKESSAQNIEALKSSVDQIYDLNKWLLGAMALAIVGLAVTRLLSAKSE